MSNVLEVIWEKVRADRRHVRKGRRTPVDARNDASSVLLSPADAKELARSAQREVLENLARNPQTPTNVMIRLARHRNGAVARVACASPKVPWEAAREVLDARGRRPFESANCPPDVLRAEAELHHPQQPAALLAHPNCPVELAEQALTRRNTENQLGQTRLLAALRCPQLTQDHYDELVTDLEGRLRTEARSAWARNPGAADRWVERMARHEQQDWWLMQALLSRPHLPAEAVETLAATTTHRARAVAHPACPAHVMAAWLNDRNGVWGGDIYAAVVSNPMAPLEVLDQLPAHAIGLRDLFVLAHARTGAQAALMYELQPTWSDSLGALVRVTAAAAH